MSNIFSASIGKKLIMSISGAFLMLFLVIHLIINLLLLFGEEVFNEGAHFMATNPAIQLIEPLLAVGFIIHILYASILTLQNQKARPENYNSVDQSESSSWASRNMYILGGTILAFLVIHILNFYMEMKFHIDIPIDNVHYDGENKYLLVSSLFGEWYYALIYLIGAIFLGLHLSHGFWSAFQSVGLSNDTVKKGISTFGKLYAIIIGAGFSIIPIYFLIKLLIK